MKDTWYVRLRHRNGYWDHAVGNFKAQIEAEQAARTALELNWLTYRMAHVSGWEGGNFVRSQNIMLRDDLAGDLEPMGSN